MEEDASAASPQHVRSLLDEWSRAAVSRSGQAKPEFNSAVKIAAALVEYEESEQLVSEGEISSEGVEQVLEQMHEEQLRGAPLPSAASREPDFLFPTRKRVSAPRSSLFGQARTWGCSADRASQVRDPTARKSSSGRGA